MNKDDKQIKPKKWQYRPSKKVRKHISHWEGSDFEKQNLQFGGDAVAAKGVEFSKMMGDRGKYFTQDELDGMFSTFYNIAPDTFKKVILPQVDKYVGDTSPDNLQAIQDTMRNRWTLAKKVHQNGIRNRANADADLMGVTTSGTIKGLTLPDSRTVIFPLLKWEDTKQPEFLPQPVIKPVVSLNTTPAPAPVVTNTPVAVNNKQDVWDTFDRGAVAYGNRPLLPPLSKLMPSLDEMIADSQTEFVRDTLYIENPFKDVLIHARNGKLPRYGNGIVPIVTDVDTRSDTTRLGYHEGEIPWGAGNGPAGQGPLLLLDVGPGMTNPNLQYGDTPGVGLNPRSAINVIKKGVKNLGRMGNMQSYDDYIREAEKYGSNFWWSRPGMAEDPNIINQMNKREEMLGNVWKALKKKELIEDLGGVGAVGYGAYKQYKKNYKSGKSPKLKSRTIQ